jgi:hypothetical protein
MRERFLPEHLGWRYAILVRPHSTRTTIVVLPTRAPFMAWTSPFRTLAGTRLLRAAHLWHATLPCRAPTIVGDGTLALSAVPDFI